MGLQARVRRRAFFVASAAEMGLQRRQQFLFLSAERGAEAPLYPSLEETVIAKLL